MFNLFKKKNKIKELEKRLLLVESTTTTLNTIITALNEQEDNNRVKIETIISDLEATPADIKSLKADEIYVEQLNIGTLKGGSIIDRGFSTPTPWEPCPCESNGDLILQIDGDVIGKVTLNQLRKMQRQGGITLIPV